MEEQQEIIRTTVLNAYQSQQPLVIQAGNSKEFYGRRIHGAPVSIKNHIGITEYEPSELFITANSGTLLSTIEQTIASENQILPFEPPHFATSATLGGIVATGLSGPRRINSGAVRDCMLGCEIINGKGEYLRFGGKVMKNVAGYDVSRLMCGANGTLGILMSITLRLLPKSKCEQTIVQNIALPDAIDAMNKLASSNYPITATFYHENKLYIRLTGHTSTVSKCIQQIGGEVIDDGDKFWHDVKEQRHSFFSSNSPLWRISVPPNTKKLNIPGDCAMEWHGALRWYTTDENSETIRNIVSEARGHACLFKGNTQNEVFHPISKHSFNIHKNLKNAFDPKNILNFEKMYVGL